MAELSLASPILPGWEEVSGGQLQPGSPLYPSPGYHGSSGRWPPGTYWVHKMKRISSDTHPMDPYFVELRNRRRLTVAE